MKSCFAKEHLTNLIKSNIKRKKEVYVFEDKFKRMEENPNTFSYWYNKVIKKCGNEFMIPKTLIFKASLYLIRSSFMDDSEKDDKTITEYVKNDIMPNIPEDMFFLFVKNGTCSDIYG